MELLVGALVVLGFLAILVRFIGRDASGEIRLPRVVDDSIGMWTLRRMTGRRLGQRAWDDEVDGGQQLDPNASEATRAALGAIAASNAVSAADAANATVVPARVAPALGARSRVAPTLGARTPVPTRDIAVRPRAKPQPGYSASMLSPTPVLDLRRRQQGLAPPRRSSRRHRYAALGVAAAVVIVAIVALGFAVQQQPPQGQVLAATGRPQLPGPAAVGAEGGSPSASSSIVAHDLTLPKASITGLTKSSIVGSSKLRVTLTWTQTDSGSGLRSQLLQRRTDDGSWVTVSLASASTRKAAFAMSHGHTYTFRIRGTDRAGNVGLFASKSIRI